MAERPTPVHTPFYPGLVRELRAFMRTDPARWSAHLDTLQGIERDLCDGRRPRALARLAALVIDVLEV